jgi:hypothetical protein
MLTSEAIAQLLRNDGYIVINPTEANVIKNILSTSTQGATDAPKKAVPKKQVETSEQSDEPGPGIEMSESKRKVYLAIKAGKQTIEAIEAKTGCSRPSVYKYITELIGDQLIMRESKGHYKLPGADGSSTHSNKHIDEENDTPGSERL